MRKIIIYMRTKLVRKKYHSLLLTFLLFHLGLTPLENATSNINVSISHETNFRYFCETIFFNWINFLHKKDLMTNVFVPSKLQTATKKNF